MDIESLDEENESEMKDEKLKFEPKGTYPLVLLCLQQARVIAITNLLVLYEHAYCYDDFPSELPPKTENQTMSDH